LRIISEVMRRPLLLRKRPCTPW